MFLFSMFFSMGRDGCLIKCRVQFRLEWLVWRFWSILSENILKVNHCVPISAVDQKSDYMLLNKYNWKKIAKILQLFFFFFSYSNVTGGIEGILICKASYPNIMQSCVALLWTGPFPALRFLWVGTAYIID